MPKEYGNTRAWGYFLLNELINEERIIMDSPQTIKELEEIRFKYKSNGERLIMSKDEMRKEGIHSPDRADSLMMAVFTMKQYLNDKDNLMTYGVSTNIRRRNVSMY